MLIGLWSNAKIAVSLKYIRSFFRSLELPLINTKLYIELNWTKHSAISNVDGATAFQITKTELYAPVVTLNTDTAQNPIFSHGENMGKNTKR